MKRGSVEHHYEAGDGWVEVRGVHTRCWRCWSFIHRLPAVEIDADVFVCEGCVKLMDGYYCDPLTKLSPDELIRIVIAQRAEIRALQDEASRIANKIAEQIYRDAANHHA